MDTVTVKDIMTTEVVSVHPETPVIEANDAISSHHFNGVPVVDAAGTLVGILTDYDLLVKGTSLHLPTFQKMISEIQVYKKDQSALAKEVEELRGITVADVMNVEPLTLPDTASLDEVITAFREHHRVNPIPVIDASRKVVGVVSRFDVLKPLKLAFVPNG